MEIKKSDIKKRVAFFSKGFFHSENFTIRAELIVGSMIADDNAVIILNHPSLHLAPIPKKAHYIIQDYLMGFMQ